MALKFVDNRDNEEYNLVRIGNQHWFAENLRYRIPKCSYLYKDDYRLYQKNGYLYSREALDKVCPPGWRIPTALDFKMLYKNLKNSALAMSWVEMLAGKHLEDNHSLQLGGFGSTAQMEFWDEGHGAYFWTSDRGEFYDEKYCVIDHSGLKFRYAAPLQNLFSIRLVETQNRVLL
jgi:uncharacterized protein (TIGR02145 family)